MQISCKSRIEPITQNAFHEIDYVVMRHAFDIHNELGRFFDEKIYQAELAERCRKAGMNCETEVEVRLAYRSFSKSYYLDLLIEHGAIFELKAVEALLSCHDSQLINYLLINQLQHGKLVNFRPLSVQHRFVSTSLTGSDRFDYAWNTTSMPEKLLSEDGRLFIQRVKELLDEWGAFLDITLYKEAIAALTSGPQSRITTPVDVMIGGRIIGTQSMDLLNPSEGWHLSSVRTAQSTYEEHLTRQFSHTTLKTLYWINLNHREICVKVLRS